MKEHRAPVSTLAFALILTLLSGVSHAASPAQLVLGTSTMNFGNVVIGSTTQVVESIRNPTASAISIVSAAIDGGNFQVSGTTFPLTVAPGQEIHLGIIFSPSTSGSVSGSLLISLDGTTPYVTVPLYGIGVIPGRMSASPASISFSGGSPTQSIAETVTNSGATNVVLQSATSTGSGFALTGPGLPLVLRPNQSATFTIYMIPTSTGTARGNINFSGLVRWWTPGARGKYQAATTTSSATSLVIPVSGTAAAIVGRLTAAPSTVSFGTLQVGNTQSLPATVTNSGAGPVTITQSTASGSGFGLSGLPLPTTLTPGESVTFFASFTPRAAGAAQGNIVVVSNASNSTVSLALAGSANTPGQLALSPSSLNFGTVVIGKNQQLKATLTASGSSVTISSASVSNSEFSLSGMPLPVTIPAGQSASFTVTFAPQAAGATSASIDFGGTASTTVEAVSGVGSAPVQHSVALSWSPGGSSVTGYNIYRGTQTGGPYAKLNTTAAVANTYGDGAVNSGQTYFYVTTALDSAGSESTHSNEVQAVIP